MTFDPSDVLIIVAASIGLTWLITSIYMESKTPPDSVLRKTHEALQKLHHTTEQAYHELLDSLGELNDRHNPGQPLIVRKLRAGE